MHQNLVERDEAVIWHPFTHQQNRPPIIPIERGKGSWLFDDKGNGFIDAISSWWVTLHGHANDVIAKKIYEQALQIEQVIFAGFTHTPAIVLAEELLKILPNHFTKIFYSDNGSTSTEVAIKMALQYWWNNGETNRNKIIAFNNSYHGDTFGAMSVSDRSVFTLAFQEKLFDVIFIDAPTETTIDACKATFHQYKNEIAAFIYEPLVQGAGGMCMYDAYLMNELLNTAKLQDVICIADEVMTGFGRTGTFFASNYMHKQPDIICLSKGLTGGTMALGVTACSSKIYNAFVTDNKLKTFFHGHSFTANPLACTAAIASLQLLQEESCITAIETITKQNKLAADYLLQQNLPLKNIRTLGTILAFEIESGKDEYLNNISFSITQKAMQQQVYIRPLGNTVYIMPPYCISKNELDKVYEVLHNVCTL